ncbi:hypothetical protein [Iodobacter fluviatilis]|uniref:hypothetical protein n=1 Tax=Iodobacter fluviatilis TaxID=537 RepID=UPI000E1BCB41|nr:hypothetical protein [Iodobacter fluviatilis]
MKPFGLEPACACWASVARMSKEWLRIAAEGRGKDRGFAKWRGIKGEGYLRQGSVLLMKQMGGQAGAGLSCSRT